VLVENAPGAGGTLGTNKVFNAPQDGYTMVLADATTAVLSPLAYNAAQYKSEDWRVLNLGGRSDLVLVVSPKLAVNNLNEFIALVKAQSATKPLSYCSVGNGSLYHLVTEKFLGVIGAKGLHVPYTAFPQCVQNLVGGTMDYAFVPIAGPFPGMIDAGQLKAFATTGAGQSTRLPTLPQLKNTKGLEELNLGIWAALQVRATTPEPIQQALYAAMVKVQAAGELRKALEASGSVLEPQLPAYNVMQANYKREIDFYSGLAKQVGVQKQ
jgi:tripartite-type tricarboxylate transporter receptor subunit TctC